MLPPCRSNLPPHSFCCWYSRLAWWLDGWMDGWWLKKILGWRSTWGRVFFLPEEEWEAGAISFDRFAHRWVKAVGHAELEVFVLGKVLNMSQVQKANTPFQSIGDQTLLRHGCPENEFSLFLLQQWSSREFILPHSMFGVGLHESLRWRLVGIFQQPCLWYWYQTPRQGKCFQR